MKLLIKTVLSLFLISICSNSPKIAQAKDSHLDEIATSEGEVVYQFQYKYDEIYKLLGLTAKEYDVYWKKGLSIAEMAEKQGIGREKLYEYFVTLHYNEMEKWKSKGILVGHLYFTQVYTLKEEIDDFLDRNPVYKK
ncbi:hypothetical protein [Lysinibacillus sp. NPDC092081]|uniref:hypothetical protein n=1 Tax=Lysinibacillus sp. NPDC092081 TaxID=3364131 RepID=UPI003821538C